MRILGIDPGFAIVGFSVIESSKAITYGIIETTKSDMRLLKIYKELLKIIDEYKPEYIAIEKLFFNKNVTTAISVAEARGVILLAALENKLKIASYTPLQVKQGVTGYGRSTKKDVQMMVKIIFELDEFPQDDAADSLAIALTHENYLNNTMQLNNIDIE